MERKKNETKTKKKNTHEYNFLDSSRVLVILLIEQTCKSFSVIVSRKEAKHILPNSRISGVIKKPETIKHKLYDDKINHTERVCKIGNNRPIINNKYVQCGEIYSKQCNGLS